MSDKTLPLNDGSLSNLVYRWIVRKAGCEKQTTMLRKVNACWAELSSSTLHERIRIGNFSFAKSCFSGNLDDFFVFKNCKVCLLDQSNLSYDSNCVVFEFIPIDILSGKLRQISTSSFDADVYHRVEESNFLCSKKFLEACLGLAPEGSKIISAGIKCGSLEPYLCLQCPFPESKNDWVERNPERAWPSENHVRRIISGGCHLLPMGKDCGSDDSSDLIWSLCFSVSEDTLICSLTHFQYILYRTFCVLIGEFILKEEENEEVEEGTLTLNRQTINHFFFLTVEESFPNVTPNEYFGRCLQLLLQKFHHCVEKVEIKHYFFTGINLIEGLSASSKAKVLERISRARENWFSALILCKGFPKLEKAVAEAIPPVGFVNEPYSETQRDYDFFFIVSYFTHCTLTFEETLARLTRALCMLQTSNEQMTLGFLNFHIRALFSAFGRIVFEKAHVCNTNKTRYNRLILSENLLRKGCKKDVTDSRLALATFYYVTGRFESASLVLDDLLQRYKQYVVYRSTRRGIIANAYRTEAFEIDTCNRNLESWEKTTIALATDHEIFVTPKHSIIPMCLKTEMWLSSSPPFRMFHLPPLPYTFCLQCLVHNEIPNTPPERLLEYIRSLQATLYDEEMEGCDILIHNMSGLCLETIRKYSEAMKEFVTSHKMEMKDKTPDEDNPSLWRIAILIKKALNCN